MKSPMECTKDGNITTWDSKSEMKNDLESCGCLACDDLLQELRGEK